MSKHRIDVNYRGSLKKLRSKAKVVVSNLRMTTEIISNFMIFKIVMFLVILTLFKCSSIAVEELAVVVRKTITAVDSYYPNPDEEPPRPDYTIIISYG